MKELNVQNGYSKYDPLPEPSHGQIGVIDTKQRDQVKAKLLVDEENTVSTSSIEEANEEASAKAAGAQEVTVFDIVPNSVRVETNGTATVTVDSFIQVGTKRTEIPFTATAKSGTPTYFSVSTDGNIIKITATASTGNGTVEVKAGEQTKTLNVEVFADLTEGSVKPGEDTSEESSDQFISPKE